MVVFNLFVDVASVVNILKTTTHNGFPVVELFGEEEVIFEKICKVSFLFNFFSLKSDI